MVAEALALPGAVRMIVIIIEPALADPDHAGMLGLLDQGRGLDVRMHIRLVRVDADRRHDVTFPLGHADHRVPFGGAGRDVEHLRHAGRPGTGEHGLLVLDQAFVVQVAVAIDEHVGACSGCRLVRHPRQTGRRA